MAVKFHVQTVTIDLPPRGETRHACEVAVFPAPRPRMITSLQISSCVDAACRLPHVLVSAEEGLFSPDLGAYDVLAHLESVLPS